MDSRRKILMGERGMVPALGDSDGHLVRVTLLRATDGTLCDAFGVPLRETGEASLLGWGGLDGPAITMKSEAGHEFVVPRRSVRGDEGTYGIREMTVFFTDGNGEEHDLNADGVLCETLTDLADFVRELHEQGAFSARIRRPWETEAEAEAAAEAEDPEEARMRSEAVRDNLLAEIADMPGD